MILNKFWDDDPNSVWQDVEKYVFEKIERTSQNLPFLDQKTNGAKMQMTWEINMTK